MSQYDFGTIDPDAEDGTELATLLGLWRDALNSNHRDTARPSYVVAGMVWVKTVSGTVEQLLVYDGANDLLLATFNPTAHTIAIPDVNLSANPKALAGLTGAANKGVYFTGAGAMALYTLTSFGRSLAGAADATAAKALLGSTDQATQDNIALLAFQISVVGGLAYLLMEDGIADAFNDTTGVDAAGSTNEVYDVAGKDYGNGAPQTSAGPATLSVINSGFPGSYTIRQVIAAAQVSTSGAAARVTFKAPSSGTFTIDKAYIGHAAASGDAYDFLATPVQLTFSAANGFTIANGAEIVSDWATFALDETKNLIVAFHLNNVPLGADASVTGWSTYYITGDDASTTNTSGYTDFTSTAHALAVKQVEVKTVSASVDIRSVAFTASTQPASARLVLEHEPVDAITLNTDLKAYASRDGGTTWTQGTLGNEGAYASGRNILSADVDLSAQPAGTSMKWRIEFLNTKKQNLHAAALQWRS